MNDWKLLTTLILAGSSVVKSVLLTGYLIWFAGSVTDFRQWLAKMSTKHQVENLLSQELANARSKILKLKSVQKNKIPFLSDSPFIMSFEWILWLETSHVNNLLDGVWYWVPYLWRLKCGYYWIGSCSFQAKPILVVQIEIGFHVTN